MRRELISLSITKSSKEVDSMKISKVAIYSALLTVLGTVATVKADYAANNTIQGAINAFYDLFVAVVAGIIPYVPAFIGLGVLTFLVGVFTLLIGGALALVMIFQKFGRHK
jgi:uncharacterized 2Fe-2S/4Fe-4S cluster protein (DUF4445 family)